MNVDIGDEIDAKHSMIKTQSESFVKHSPSVEVSIKKKNVKIVFEFPQITFKFHLYRYD